MCKCFRNTWFICLFFYTIYANSPLSIQDHWENHFGKLYVGKLLGLDLNGWLPLTFSRKKKFEHKVTCKLNEPHTEALAHRHKSIDSSKILSLNSTCGQIKHFIKLKLILSLIMTLLACFASRNNQVPFFSMGSSYSRQKKVVFTLLVMVSCAFFNKLFSSKMM